MSERSPGVPRARRRSWRRRCAVVASSGVLAFAAGEILVRSRGWARNVGPSFSEWDAEDGARLRRGLACTRITPEFTFEMSTNEAGFRGPELPTRIERSIVFLGDSFTMGYGVDDGREFVALFAARSAPDWTIVNAGLGGAGNGRWIHFLERDAPGLSPRLVVLQACENDFDDNLNEGLYVLDADGSLLAKKPPEAGVLRTLARVVETVPGLSSSHLIALGRNIRRPSAVVGQALPAAEPTSPPGADLTLHILSRAIEQCRARGWPMLAIVCAEAGARRTLLASCFEQHGVRAILAAPKSTHPDLYYRIDGHWNEAGHAQMAELVSEALRSSPYAEILAPSSR